MLHACPAFPMKVTGVSMSREGATKSKQRTRHVGRFFFFTIPKVSSPTDTASSSPAERCGEKTTAWRLEASPRQCVCPFLVNCAGLLGANSDSSGLSQLMQLSWFVSLRLQNFLKATISVESKEILVRERDQGECDEAADGDPEKGLCRLFPKVEGTLG